MKTHSNLQIAQLAGYRLVATRALVDEEKKKIKNYISILKILVKTGHRV